ncbi:MAG: aminotransferase class III-fold pyridoxal phosphate-dependent enzyme, partial [Burkholderiales bacterium]|nr:aminotransferase class III-fold pyridoxal phosphate-dependent enzyme [Burkholderiales bacterium]
LNIAAINGSQAITISGASDSVQSLAKRLEVDGIKVRTLRVSTAFHSVLLEPILDAYRQALQSVQWRPLELPVCSNLTGELFPSRHVYDVEYWIRHTREAVQFAGNMKALGQAGVDTTIELGILPVLSGMVDDIVPQLRTLQGVGLGSDDCAGFLNTIAQLHASGVPLKFPHVAGQAAGDALPLYPFAKDVFPLRIGAESFSISDFGAELRKTPVSTESISRLNIEIANRNASVPQTIAEIRQRIIALIANLLAINVEKIDASTPLLEIGADSLILMQAVGRIESEFGIKIPVRSFFENLSTIDAVAAFLAEKSLVARAESEADNSAPPPPTTTSNVPPVPARALPPKTSLTNNLSEQQRRHLDLFCADYCARTALSKQHAQRYRQVLADSRASAGFRFSIKEMLYPIVGQRADGAKIWDIDGNEYVDISMGFGVQLFGHEPAFLKKALSESMSRGLRIGPQSDTAGEVAELISELTGVERVSFCSSGTEAIMTALRLARTATGRRKVAVFKDSYHGHFDGVLGDVGEDPWMVQPRVAGITPGMVSDLAFFEYGSEDALTQLSSRLGEFAAVLVEPVQSRNPGLQPAEFLRRLRQVTKAA